MNKDILAYLPDLIKKELLKFSFKNKEKIIELRLRVNQPLEIVTTKNYYFLKNKKNKNYIINKNLIKKTFNILTENSLYAMERELKEGFITVNGGHRVGFTGEVVLRNNKIVSIKNINSINFRIAHQIIGVADKLIDYLYNKELDFYYNTLIIGPPLSGKTTLLRDLIRICSTGIMKKNIRSFKVSVIDERSEIGGSYKGIPQNNLGKRTDLLDNCPKSQGILMLIRTMSPEIIAIDEIGGDNDINAIIRALNSGVILLATIHGYNYQSVFNKKVFNKLKELNLFKRIVILSSKKLGKVKSIVDEKGGRLICSL
ncbi:MAG: stage III sporulation protein AA [Bacillota bacterium]